MSKESKGNVDQVENQGIIIYGKDGTHLRPVKVNASGEFILSIEKLTEILKPVGVQTRTVSCPAYPAEIKGITADTGYTANDAMGKLTMVEVPKSGIIYSATLWDLDYEGLQVDLEIFRSKITQVADMDAWTISDAEILYFVTEIAFFAFDGHTLSYTSEVKNIGKAYTAPEGKFWIQAVTRGAHDINPAEMPRFQLQILSDDPEWQER